MESLEDQSEPPTADEACRQLEVEVSSLKRELAEVRKELAAKARPASTYPLLVVLVLYCLCLVSFIMLTHTVSLLLPLRRTADGAAEQTRPNRQGRTGKVGRAASNRAGSSSSCPQRPRHHGT